MKRIRYTYRVPVNIGTEDEPVLREEAFEKSLPYSDTALQIAMEEADSSGYTIEDDGTEAQESASDSQVLNALLGVAE